MLSGEHFVSEGLITQDDLDLALQKHKELGGAEPVARVLVSMGLVSERDRVRCLGKVWGIPFVDISDVVPQPEALEIITPQVAKRFKCVPLERRGDKLMVAMVNPLDVFTIAR